MSETTDSSASLAPLLDDSSADVTSQLPTAERTVTDLDAFTPDATGEISALDILEVVEVLRTPPSTAVSHVPSAPPPSRAAEVLETSRLPAVMIAPRPSMPSMPSISMPHAPSGHHPTSIAPLALDVSPPPRASYASASWHTPTPPDLRESTLQIARAAGIPSRASRIVVFTASVVGMCMVAGILGVMLGYSHGPAKNAQPTSLAAPVPVAPVATAPASPVGPVAPRVAVVTGAHEEITEGPILVPAKDAASISEAADDGVATAAPAPAPAPSPVAVAAPAPRSAPAAPAARAAAPVSRSSSSTSSTSTSTSSSTGVLRLPATVSGVLIDGVPHKAGGGGLVVSCGRHTVKAPGHPSRLVIVPCGGSAAL